MPTGAPEGSDDYFVFVEGVVEMAGHAAASTRSELLENLGGVDETAGVDIGLGLAQGGVKGRAVGLIEPVPWVERQQLDLSSLGQIGGLVYHQPTGSNTSLDSHN